MNLFEMCEKYQMRFGDSADFIENYGSGKSTIEMCEKCPNRIECTEYLKLLEE